MTDVFELDIIELPKVKKAIKNNTFKGFSNLKDWMDFMINPLSGNKNMDDLDDKIKKAYDEWQKFNQNEEERDLAERRYKNLAREKYALEYERKTGLEECTKKR